MASTTINSARLPNVPDAHIYHIMVFANTGDPETRKMIEQAFEQTQESITFTGSNRYLAQGRLYTPAQLDTILHTYHFDGVLLLQKTFQGAKTVTTGKASMQTSCDGLWVNGACTQQPTITFTPAPTAKKPYVGFSFALYETETLKPIWVANTTTGGNIFADMGTLIKSLTKEIAARMTAEVQ